MAELDVDLFRPCREKNVILLYMNNKGAEQPAHAQSGQHLCHLLPGMSVIAKLANCEISKV